MTVPSRAKPATSAAVDAGQAVDAVDATTHMCRALTRLVPADASAITIHQGAGTAVTIGASTPTAQIAEQLQIILGEGPALTCARSAQRVLEPDLRSLTARARWPELTGRMSRRTPYQAVFSFPLPRLNPLNVAGRPIAVLSLYQHAAGPLTPAAIEQIDQCCGGINEFLRHSPLWIPRQPHAARGTVVTGGRPPRRS